MRVPTRASGLSKIEIPDAKVEDRERISVDRAEISFKLTAAGVFQYMRSPPSSVSSGARAGSM